MPIALARRRFVIVYAVSIGIMACTGTEGGPGPQGSAGPAGPAGPQGAVGAQGLQGPQGPAGPQGAPGAVAVLVSDDGGTIFIDGGIAFVSGPRGPAGPEGAQGLQGPQGVAGPQGLQGPQGLVGPAGPSASTQEITDALADAGVAREPTLQQVLTKVTAIDSAQTAQATQLAALKADIAALKELLAPSACPSDMVLGGAPGSEGAFCVDKIARAAATWIAAMNTCGNLGRRVCSESQWLRASALPGVTLTCGSQWEWVAEPDHAYTSGHLRILAGGNANCAVRSWGWDGMHGNMSGPYPFRCCLGTLASMTR